MRYLIVLALAFILLAPLAYADNTDTGRWNEPVIDGNPMALHSHQYEEYKAPLGIGLDVVCYEKGPYSVEVQNKYDFPNQVYSGFVVGKVHLYSIVTGK